MGREVHGAERGGEREKQEAEPPGSGAGRSRAAFARELAQREADRAHVDRAVHPERRPPERPVRAPVVGPQHAEDHFAPEVPETVQGAVDADADDCPHRPRRVVIPVDGVEEPGRQGAEEESTHQQGPPAPEQQARAMEGEQLQSWPQDGHDLEVRPRGQSREAPEDRQCPRPGGLGPGRQRGEGQKENPDAKDVRLEVGLSDRAPVREEEGRDRREGRRRPAGGFVESPPRQEIEAKRKQERPADRVQPHEEHRRPEHIERRDEMDPVQ